MTRKTDRNCYEVYTTGMAKNQKRFQLYTTGMAKNQKRFLVCFFAEFKSAVYLLVKNEPDIKEWIDYLKQTLRIFHGIFPPDAHVFDRDAVRGHLKLHTDNRKCVQIGKSVNCRYQKPTPKNKIPCQHIWGTMACVKDHLMEHLKQIISKLRTTKEPITRTISWAVTYFDLLMKDVIDQLERANLQ